MAKALSIARSNLYERLDNPACVRRPRKNASDVELLQKIMTIVDERPTYGYRRVCAVLARQLKEAGLAAINHKRIYRLMKQNDLLLAHNSIRHEKRAHTGKIVTESSDQRWCSDGFELACQNGEKVRAIFVLDCCDREVISIAASTGGYTADMAQSALLGAIENRFGTQEAPHWLEWLTDNGSCFIAKETLSFARSARIINCYTPVRSPESNGMAEAFVKTLKRDYASVNELANATQVMSMLEKWVEDYNEYAPHKGLGWLSPRQYRRVTPGNFPGAARVTKAA